MKWEALDVQALLARKASMEATTSANVGAYVVPLGQVLRPPAGLAGGMGAVGDPSFGVGVAGGHWQDIEDVLSAYDHMVTGGKNSKR